MEPKEEAIIGTFLSIRNENKNVEEMEIEIEIQERERPKKTYQEKEKKEVKSRDIRNIFQNPRNDSRKDTIIIID